MLGKVMFWAGAFGAVANLVNGPLPKNPLGAALAGAGLVLLVWYPIKATFICCETATRFKKEGRPLFEAGGLTEYDSEKCRRIGEATAKAIRENKS